MKSAQSTESICCAAADPKPRPPIFALPPGAADCHAHVCLDDRLFPEQVPRSYTPPPAHIEVHSMDLLNMLAVWAPDEVLRHDILVRNPKALHGLTPVANEVIPS